ncbi:hypothetical protein ABFS82_12G029900 [Erythranthe guttata]|uniref:probable receptor-like protein kinase At1g67000 n=1 Tax=Erythranthe guttata TaxID=4155 RepID=UPI00064E0DF3|nr:PREDICTED: probable receptor-like protein kinase At1g67000 [Erythranthe guttata]|eukprot:XP_012841000.1 PREDICTED: probable receptor-like protein kinase At1g67000 [Erythranthe guttata]
MEHKHLILWFVAILLAIYFPCFLSQICNGVPFDCGNVRYISYPFWGSARPRSCGRSPGYKLICDNGLPKLNISSLTYVVQKINFDDNTLKIAREDLLTNTCPTIIRDTTIDRALFEYTSESEENNVTLYYGCSDKNGETGNLESKPNRFSCDGGGVNLFDESPEGPGPNITCGESITVPVSKDDAQSLENPTSSSINILQSALASGFSVRWLSDGKERSIPYCNSQVYATCLSPPRVRYCNMYNCSHDSSVVSPPSPHPEQFPQAPAYSPESGGNDLHTGHGLPPSLSPIAAAYYPGNDGSYNHDKHGRRNHVTEIIIAVVVLLSISGVIIVFIATKLCLKQGRTPTGPNQKSNQDVESILLQHGLLAPKRYKYSEIKKITKSFNEKLGQGGYGSVYKGVLSDGTLVAVKVLIEADGNGEEFINEVASISRTSHVNIVNLLGFSFDRNKRALMYEFMPNKSLDKFINNNNCLDLEKLYEIAVGVAKGLEYLHIGCKTRIVHFDIKPQNILLDEEFCPKISDFGLAKLCKKKQSILSVLGTRGTIGYIAPEVFSRNFGGVSHKSDVYSYGMMVLEMAGARKFAGNEEVQSSENYFPDKIYEYVVDATEKANDLIVIDDDDEVARKMFLIGFWCIQTTPSDRPSMSKVVEMLEGSIESIQVPPKPVLCTPTLGKKEISSFSVYVETENSDED